MDRALLDRTQIRLVWRHPTGCEFAHLFGVEDDGPSTARCGARLDVAGAAPLVSTSRQCRDCANLSRPLLDRMRESVARDQALLLAEAVLDLPGVDFFRIALDLPERALAPDPEAWARSFRRWAQVLAPRSAAELLCEGDPDLAGCEPVIEAAIASAVAGIVRDRAPEAEERLALVRYLVPATTDEVVSLQPIADAVAQAAGYALDECEDGLGS